MDGAATVTPCNSSSQSPGAQLSSAGPPASTLAMGMGIILIKKRQAACTARWPPPGQRISNPQEQQPAPGPAPAHTRQSCSTTARRPPAGPGRPSQRLAKGKTPPARQQPSEDDQGATGGLRRRASGTHPHPTRPKTGNCPSSFALPQWGVVRFGQCRRRGGWRRRRAGLDVAARGFPVPWLFLL